MITWNDIGWGLLLGFLLLVAFPLTMQWGIENSTYPVYNQQINFTVEYKNIQPYITDTNNYVIDVGTVNYNIVKKGESYTCYYNPVRQMCEGLVQPLN